MKTIPVEIKTDMKLWRMGAIGMPSEYIGFHKELAEESISKLPVIVHRTWMEDDGWMDGMLVLMAIVEDPRTHKLSKIKWSDGNQGWMEKLEYGWGSFKVL